MVAAPDAGLSLSQIASATGFNTSTTAAILATLDDAGYAHREPDRSYIPGPSLIRLASGLGRRYPMLGAANEELSRLSAATGFGATLSRISDDSIEVIVTAGDIDEFDSQAGRRLPLYPSGTLAVAWRSPAQIEDWLSAAEPPLDLAGTAAVQRTLAELREMRFAVYDLRSDVHSVVQQLRDLLDQAGDQTPTEEIRRLVQDTSVGVYTTAELAEPKRRPVSYVITPVFGPDRQPRYLLSLHVMAEAVTGDDLRDYIDQLLRCAETLTHGSGGRLPDFNPGPRG